MKYVVGVTGTPGAGKSSFCKALHKKYKELERNVKIYNVDAGCEVNLMYKPDWNVTDHVKVSEIMMDEGLGSNGGLMEAMRLILEEKSYLVINEMLAADEETFFILDLPGQIELFMLRSTMKDFYRELNGHGFKIINLYMIESSILKTPDFFTAYSTNVLLSMLHMCVPQINLITKMDLIRNAKHGNKLNFAFSNYANADCDLQDRKGQLKDNNPTYPGSRFAKLTAALVEVNASYEILEYVPMTVSDDIFLMYICMKIDAVLWFTPKLPLPISKNDILDYVETFLEKCVKTSNRKLVPPLQK